MASNCPFRTHAIAARCVREPFGSCTSYSAIAAPPSGIALVRGLDPQSTVLADNLDAIVAECMAMPYSVLDADKPGTLRLHPNRWEDVLPLLA